MSITIKSPAEQDAMREAGRLTAAVLDMIGPYIQPGVTTDELNQICHDYIVDVQQAIPAPLNYRGFPKSICTSVNHVVCHGIPSAKTLRLGDLINVDITVIKDGFHGDSSRMFSVGKATIQGERVVRVSREALWLGIAQARPGNRLGDIGHAIQQYVEAQGFSVVREYCGHGIGRIFHEDPQVLHYGVGVTGRTHLHHRTDGECRQASRSPATRWLDGGDPRSLAVSPVGTHHPDHQGRLRGTDPGR